MSGWRCTSLLQTRNNNRYKITRQNAEEYKKHLQGIYSKQECEAESEEEALDSTWSWSKQRSPGIWLLLGEAEQRFSGPGRDVNRIVTEARCWWCAWQVPGTARRPLWLQSMGARRRVGRKVGKQQQPQRWQTLLPRSGLWISSWVKWEPGEAESGEVTYLITFQNAHCAHVWKTDGGQKNLWACVNRSRGRQSLHGLRWYDGGGIGWLRFGTYSEGKSNMCLNSGYELWKKENEKTPTFQA